MASALLHMSCPLKNDIIGMDTNGLEGFQSLERGKRDHDLDELDRCQVKKRRKQSKPNRIASTEPFAEGESKASLWPAEAKASEERGERAAGREDEEREEERGYSEGEESPDENSPALYQQDVKTEFSYPLNLSHKTPSPHNSADSYSSNPEERGWYKVNENPSQLFNLSQNSDPINLKTQPYQSNLYQPSQACNMILPNFKRIIVGNNENQIGSPHRIFNPEAFCDLCNKEFCNKYFLKTHKANKHGIYMENIGSNPMENLPALPLMNYFSSNIVNLPLPVNNPPPPPVKKTTTNYSSNNCNSRSNSSMRAFCNICQREFCNKYFVRRHKAKIHGIVENNNDADAKLPPPVEKIDLEATLPGPSTFKGNKDIQNNKEVTEPIPEEEKTIVKKEQVEPEENGSPQDALSFLVSTWQTEDSKECTKSPERPKKANSNSSAFCDICCKGYCNKYFLRVHKQKVHGIPFPEKEEKSKEPSYNNIPKSSQPMPLNLILRENNKTPNDFVENNFPCSVCNINFSDSFSLKIHQDQAHKNEKTPDKFIPSNTRKAYSPLENQNNKPPFDYNNHNVNEISSTQHQENIGTNKRNSTPEIQKMNSMLLKLNQNLPLENYVCDVCNCDFGSMSSLETHIMRDHAPLIEEISNSFYEENQNFHNNLPNKIDVSKTQKPYPTFNLLEQHFVDKQNIGDSKSNLKMTNETHDLNSPLGLPSERQVMHTPTSSFCEICKKELCNKYFMKTHMQRMHGISIENGAHIGGVVCDICNKELCSKYFLRVHKQNSHGIVEEGFLPQIGADIKVPISSADVALRPSENELNHRYFSHFTEVCSICNRRFRSAKWLKAHLLNDHGEEGKDKWREVQQQNGGKSERPNSEQIKKAESYYNVHFKNFMQDIPPNEEVPSTSDMNNELPSFLSRPAPKQYQCSYCPFSTTVLALLLVHERTHMPPIPDVQEIRCPVCFEICETKEALEKHLSMRHNAPGFNLKKRSEDENQQMYQYEDIESSGVPMNKEESYDEAHDTNSSVIPPDDACFKCPQCSFITGHVDLYTDHMKKEHKAEEPQLDYLQVIKDALRQIAVNSNIPASFAVPHSLGNFMMQPFVLEDKAQGANPTGTFLSSLVFLPVKERLSKPITASFKLTPT